MPCLCRQVSLHRRRTKNTHTHKKSTRGGAGGKGNGRKQRCEVNDYNPCSILIGWDEHNGSSSTKCRHVLGGWGRGICSLEHHDCAGCKAPKKQVPPSCICSNRSSSTSKVGYERYPFRERPSCLCIKFTGMLTLQYTPAASTTHRMGNRRATGLCLNRYGKVPNVWERWQVFPRYDVSRR